MELAIEGMHCQACVTRVRKAIEKVDGARVEGVEIGSARVEVEARREQAVIEAIGKAGYAAKRT